MAAHGQPEIVVGVFFAAVPGRPFRRISVQPSATGSFQSAGTAISVSGWRGRYPLPSEVCTPHPVPLPRGERGRCCKLSSLSFMEKGRMRGRAAETAGQPSSFRLKGV